VEHHSYEPPTAPAGWYPDPTGAPGHRYFDGQHWTPVAPAAPLPIPAPAAPPVAVNVVMEAPAKSGFVAAVLQFFFGGFGLGRFYLGYTGIGLLQLALNIIGWATAVVLVGFVILVPLGIWILVDCFRMVSRSMPDAQGRPLR
jgi:TM2 domain-containing membrane protein YozV